MDLISISRQLAHDVDALHFAPPTAYVYNPLDYAWAPHETYLRRYGEGTREVLLVGMNPGPFGMAQTGVPFGDVAMVRDWMGIDGPVGHPDREHPARPIDGFACTRSEVSGTRLWGWARDRWGTAEQFFSRCFVANYCPLVFMEASGRNRTPDKLPAAERDPLFTACNHALRHVLETLAPKYALGIGDFATKRLQAIITPDDGITVATLPHPSPANPRANRGWAALADATFNALDIH